MVKIEKGLYIEVTASGRKHWRHRYTLDGKAHLLSLGSFPAVTLHMAKERIIENQRMIATGLDPATKHRRTEDLSQTLDQLFDSFLRNKIEGGSRESTVKQLRQRYEKWLKPAFGKRDVRSLSRSELAEWVDQQLSGGRYPTISRVTKILYHLLELAENKGYVESNSARGLTSLVPANRHKRRAAIIGIAATKEYVDRALTRCDHDLFRLALIFAPLTFLRAGELVALEWADISPERILIPGSKRKMHDDLVVPVSSGMQWVLDEVGSLHLQSPFVFASFKSPKGHIATDSLLKRARRLGYEKGELTIHGFRATAMTALVEEMDYPEHIVDLQVGHKRRGNNGDIYNRAAFLDRRREMLEAWGNSILPPEARTSS